ncbi:nucleotide pyrophosphohydrolase [Planctomycetota bacterium]
MTDAKTTIKELIEWVAAFEAERDWRQFHSPKNLAMGLAIETGELLEHFQWISEDDSRAVTDDPKQMQQVREEVADVLCYLLNLALVMGIDLSEAFFDKMKQNEIKYPADQYRGKYKL